MNNEDIKVLEETIKSIDFNNKEQVFVLGINQIKLIQNLIKGYKELEDELNKTTDLLSVCNKRLENISKYLELQDKNTYGYVYEEIFNKIKELKEENKELRKPKYIMDLKTNKITILTNDFVSKDKIREKIEDYTEKAKMPLVNSQSRREYIYGIRVLQELLQEGDDK